jgi:glutaconate CoA-transferase subunit B
METAAVTASGWTMKFATEFDETPAPTARELITLRDLKARTKATHEGKKKEAA